MDDAISCIDVADGYDWVVVAICCVVCAISFYVLNEVVEDHFVPLLTALTIKWHVRDDVIGALFLSICASASELVVNLISVLLAKSEMGAAGIVGSGLCNVLVAFGGACVVAPVGSVVSSDVLVRDVIAYALQSLVAAAVVYYGTINWYISIVLMTPYAMYFVIVMRSRHVPPVTAASVASIVVASTAIVPRENDEEPRDNDDNQNVEVVNNDSDDDDGVFETLCNPLEALLKYTIPTSSILMGTVMCMVWITASAYVLLISAVNLACVLGVTHTVIGLLLISIGTSIDDVVEALALTRAGRVDMAVSGVFGSNVFDQSVGLGLPWLLGSIFYGPIVLEGSMAMTLSLVLLSLTLVSFYCVMRVVHYKVNKVLGCFLIIGYVAWFSNIAYASMS